MLKLILHNLWARRRRNGWLLAELILVTVVSWAIFDPVIVNLHDRRLPLGYDADRMILVSLSALEEGTPGYEPRNADSASLVSAYLSLIDRVRQYPGVQSATAVLGYSYPGGTGIQQSSLPLKGDTVTGNVDFIYYLPRQQYFETYGFTPAPGRSLRELSDFPATERDIVVTQDLLQRVNGDGDPRRHSLYSLSNERDTLLHPLIGAVGPIRLRLDWRPIPLFFRAATGKDVLRYLPQYTHIALRLSEGSDVRRFLHDFVPWTQRNLRAGNLYAHRVQPYMDLLTDQAYASSTALFRRSLGVALFFLVNLCLGVAGTFWVQTRMRKEEVGVYLSFGATPRRICTMLLAEGAVLVTVAVAVGCFIYWNYAVAEGLPAGLQAVRSVQHYWTDRFAAHFALVSLAVYACLLAVTLFGVWMPARSIARIPPTEALRDE